MAEDTADQAEDNESLVVGEHNLEVLSAVSRTLGDHLAYDDLLAAIDARLDLEQSARASSGTTSLERLLAPLERMLGLAARHGDSAFADDVYAQVDASPMPAALIDHRSRAVHANAQWQGEPRLEAALEMPGVALTRVPGAIDDGGSRLVPIPGESGLCLHLKPVEDTQRRGGQIARLIVIEIAEDLEDFFAEIWSLTPAEFAVLRLLARGFDKAQIAAFRDASSDTVKRQIASILKKAGVHSQVDCVRQAHLAAQAQQVSLSTASNWTDPWHHEQMVTRPGGHALHWSWTGHPNGRPCLLIHGPDMGYALTPEWHAFLRENHLRLYAVQRPGYGNSAIGAGEDPFEASTAAIGHFVQAICGPPHLSIGLHNGALPLLRLRAEGLLGPSPILAYSDILPMTRERMAIQPVPVRAWFRMAQSAPSLLQLAARTGLHLIRTQGPEWYMQRSFGSCPADAVALTDPAVRRALDSSIHMMAAQGETAFVSELRFLGIDPGAWLSRGPTSWLAGAQDLSLDKERRIATGRKAGVRVVDVPEAGQLAFLSHPHAIHEEIVRLLENGA